MSSSVLSGLKTWGEISDINQPILALVIIIKFLGYFGLKIWT